MTASKRIIIIVLICFGFLQAGSLTGRITDASNGLALKGVNIYFSLNKNGTVSDSDGYFKLDVPESGIDTLNIRMIGFKNVLLPVDFPLRKQINVELIPVVLKGENVLVTATRMMSSIKESNISMDVIGAQEIESSSAQNIAELLQGIKSLQIKDYGGVGGMKTLSLRGATAGQTLILLDGQRINNPQNGEVDLSLIPLEHIERVEIIRGGSSALYGSDALGGVIHIITKRSESNDLEIGIANMLGSFGTYAFKGSIKYGGILAGYQFLRSDGDFKYYDKWGNIYIRDNNDIEQHHLYTRIDLSPKNALCWRFGLKYNILINDKGAPGSIQPYYHFARMEDNRQDLSFTVRYEPLYGMHKIKSQSYVLTTSNHYINEDPRDVLSPINETYLTNTYGEEIQLTSIFSKEFKLNYGVNLRLDEFVHKRLSLRYTRLTYDVYLVDETNVRFSSDIISSLKFTPSIRYNGNTDFTDRVTPKFGLLIHFGSKEQFDLIANTGMNFRSPTFNDLYWPEDSFSEGNPDLLPESSWDWDSGIRIRLNNFIFESILYDHHLTNLIIWQDHGGIWWPENISKARVNGLENSISYSIIKDHLDLKAQYTFMNAKDLSELYFQKFLVYRPMHSAKITIEGHISQFNIRMSNRYESKRYTSASNAEISALPAYLITDIGFLYNIPLKDFKIDLKADIKNLFDISYNTLKNFPMPGREYRVSVGITYNKKKKGNK